MFDHPTRAAAATALAALVAAPLALGPLQAQERDASDRERHAEIRIFRNAGPAVGDGWLGVRIEDLDEAGAEAAGLDAPRGARVTDVREGTPAAEAGLREADVIVRFDGREVRSVAHLMRLVRETPPGREVAVRILREGAEREMSVEVGERPGPRISVPGAPDGWEGPDLEGELDEERMRRIRERIERARERWKESMEEMGDSLEAVAPELRGTEDRAGRPPRLGVRIQPLTDQLAEHFGVGDRGGVLVAAVREGSAAAAGGLEAGDVIVRFGDRDVEERGDLVRAVRDGEAGPVSITLVRDGDERTLTVELPERKR